MVAPTRAAAEGVGERTSTIVASYSTSGVETQKVVLRVRYGGLYTLEVGLINDCVLFCRLARNVDPTI